MKTIKGIMTMTMTMTMMMMLAMRLHVTGHPRPSFFLFYNEDYNALIMITITIMKNLILRKKWIC